MFIVFLTELATQLAACAVASAVASHVSSGIATIAIRPTTTYTKDPIPIANVPFGS